MPIYDLTPSELLASRLPRPSSGTGRPCSRAKAAELICRYRNLQLSLIAAGARWPRGDPRKARRLSPAALAKLKIQMEYRDEQFYEEPRE